MTDMSVEEAAKATVRRGLMTMVNPARWDLMEEFYAPDVELVTTTEGTIRGRKNIRAFYEQVRSWFPDWYLTIEDMVAEGNKVAVRWTGRATHRGEMMGLPPTGNRFEVTEVTIFTTTTDPIQARRIWHFVTAEDMQSQLGIGVPPIAGKLYRLMQR